MIAWEPFDTAREREILDQYGHGSRVLAGRFDRALREIDNLRAEVDRLNKRRKADADILRRYKGRIYR